jgi:hypothetical protein
MTSKLLVSETHQRIERGAEMRVRLDHQNLTDGRLPPKGSQNKAKSGLAFLGTNFALLVRTDNQSVV